MNKPYIEQVTEILEIYKDELIDMVLYTIPTFQNPTNYTMPDEIRKELVALTHKYKNFMIIADEVYQYLYFDKKPPLPLHYYDGRVISIGSFSKILAPGLRLGWIQTKVEFMKKFNDCGLMESGGALNALACRIVYPLLNYDLIDKYIDSCRYFLKTRGEYMFEQLSEHLSEHCEFYKPNGGYFIWIRMKKDINTKTMLDIAIKNKVKYHYGEKFSSAVDANRYFRLSFSWYDQADILEGILRIKKTIEEL
jgi:DNA-binding transcriptional MocR family regulator